jgi:hypothetical protein
MRLRLEEAGYRAGQRAKISTHHITTSVTDEIGHLFLGYDLEPAALPPDDTEFFERAVMSFADVLAQVKASEVRDTPEA